MKYLLSFILSLCFVFSAFAQKHYTKAGAISFYSDAPMEKIEAHNTSASSVIDLEAGAIQWAVLIKAFEFEKALMQEHFNENYMESSSFPKAKFKGSIENAASIDLTTDGEYKLPVKGTMEIHGVEQEIETVATFTVKGGKLSAHNELTVLVADYGIEIPAVVRDNIAKEVKIVIDANYEALNK